MGHYTQLIPGKEQGGRSWLLSVNHLGDAVMYSLDDEGTTTSFVAGKVLDVVGGLVKTVHPFWCNGLSGLNPDSFLPGADRWSKVGAAIRDGSAKGAKPAVRRLANQVRQRLFLHPLGESFVSYEGQLSDWAEFYDNIDGDYRQAFAKAIADGKIQRYPRFPGNEPESNGGAA